MSILLVYMISDINRIFKYSIRVVYNGICDADCEWYNVYIIFC